MEPEIVVALLSLVGTWWFFLRCISFKQANKLSNPAIRKKGRKAQ